MGCLVASRGCLRVAVHGWCCRWVGVGCISCTSIRGRLLGLTLGLLLGLTVGPTHATAGVDLLRCVCTVLGRSPLPRIRVSGVGVVGLGSLIAQYAYMSYFVVLHGYQKCHRAGLPDRWCTSYTIEPDCWRNWLRRVVGSEALLIASAGLRWEAAEDYGSLLQRASGAEVVRVRSALAASALATAGSAVDVGSATRPRAAPAGCFAAAVANEMVPPMVPAPGCWRVAPDEGVRHGS